MSILSLMGLVSFLLIQVDKINYSLYTLAHHFNAVVAQLVERVHGKDKVSGSIPDNGSKNIAVAVFFLFQYYRGILFFCVFSTSLFYFFWYCGACVCTSSPTARIYYPNHITDCADFRLGVCNFVN